HDLGERVLRLEPVQDRVVGGDRRHLVLLEQDQAVGPERLPYDLRVGRVVLDRAHRVRARGRAHLLAAEVGQAAGRGGVVGDEHALAGVELDAGEVDLPEAVAGYRHRVRDDVDAAGAAGDRGDPLRVRDRLELDLV